MKVQPTIVNILYNFARKLSCIACAAGILASPLAVSQSIYYLPLSLGDMADYGASPWYLDGMYFGHSGLKIALDTGADFFWVTSDQCQTPACANHSKVDSSQAGFEWIDQNTKTRSFGPWGNMKTWTGKIDVGVPASFMFSLPQQFFAAIDYEGDQFGTLAWDGGMGLPSESDLIVEGSSFFFRDLYYDGHIQKAVFSFFTDASGVGIAAFGGDIPFVFDPKTEVVLEPKKAELGDLWGTELHRVMLGSEQLPDLDNQIFFLDTGSSRFKGDDIYVYPILNALYAFKDPSGNPIFEKYYENDQWVGLVYVNGGPSDYPNLPILSIVIGQSCWGGTSQEAGEIALSPEQYSYYVSTGERAGSYVIAVHRLDGIGGLLVGSTFMDLLYTRFTYDTPAAETLTQSNMYLYAKTTGDSFPYTFGCTSI